ncbi:hypothetical protein TSPI_00665 [Trichinella spiralis]|uniref:Uncharacterized protein n=1 Tax=Trichinella spiralis TaxID=6334 RepID=A0ABR3KUD0_TRISP
MASTSSRLQKMILRRLRPEFLEDSFMMGPQRHMRLQILVIKLPASRTLETTHDCLAHRWLSDFGMPSIAHAYEFDIRAVCANRIWQISAVCILLSVNTWTAGQPLYQCECAVEFRLQKMILRRLRPEFQEDSFMMGPQRHMRLQLLVIKLPVFRTLETAHDRLAHRCLSDFGMPSIAHAYEFDIRGNPSVKCTQPYVRIEFGRYQRSAYFFPLTRGQLDSLCISVNVPWNSGTISFLGF